MRRAASVVGLLVVAGCMTDPVTGKTVLGSSMSDAQEQELGFQYRPHVVQQFSGAYPDAALQSHCESIVLGMARRGARPDLAWNFTVLNSSVPNAFAVPGGEVFVTRGMLAWMDDEAEFAMVMGHEIGHVEHRHTAQSMVRDSAASAVIALVGKRLGAPQEASQLGAGLLVARFSRDQERESDVRGVHNAYTAGYDPRQGADVFRKFLQMKQQQGGGTGLEAWTSSHPLDAERIENIQRLSAEKDPRLAGDKEVQGLKVQTGRWAELIARLRGEHKVYERHDKALERAQQAGGGKDAVRGVISELDACARALPNHALLSSDLGKAYFIAGEPARAKQWLERAASMDQGLLDPEHALGVLALSSKDWRSAHDHAERGLRLLPGNYMCLYVRGEANWGLGRRAEAQADFKQVVDAAPAESSEARAAAQRLRAAP
jgi:predicted Zn-dependent protease